MLRRPLSHLFKCEFARDEHSAGFRSIEAVGLASKLVHYEFLTQKDIKKYARHGPLLWKKSPLMIRDGRPASIPLACDVASTDCMLRQRIVTFRPRSSQVLQAHS